VSVRAAVARAAARLEEAGIASPRFDAEELAAFVLGISRSALLTAAGFTPVEAERYEALVDERARRVPLQHLTGVAGFRYLELSVGPGVFIPRPETELLAGWGIDTIKGIDKPIVVDLCAGSGAIALAVAHERPDAVVYAVERERHALAWARRNADARAAAGDTPITVVAGDATAPRTLADLNAEVTMLLTNPPYVPDRAFVAPEAGEHDPGAALWGGPDGLDVVRRLVARGAALVKPGGWIGVEHADVQGESVPAVLAATGDWDEIVDHRDLAERPRFTTARRR